MNDYRITEADFDEAAELARLHIDAERQTYASTIPRFLKNVSELSGRIHMWRAVLSEKSTWRHYLVVRHTSGILIGFLSGGIPKGASDACLYGMYVLKEHQNKGVGKQLFHEYICKLHFHKVKTLSCVLPEENLQAREFFARCGGLEINHKAMLSSEFEVRMVKAAWNNIEELVKYLSLPK